MAIESRSYTTVGEPMADTQRRMGMRFVKMSVWLAVALVTSACSSRSHSSAMDDNSPASGAGAMSVTDVTAHAPQACARQQFPLQQSTGVSRSTARAVIQGHLPARLPGGFGLQEVDRVEPGDAGYAAWTDARCRRVSIFFEPGNSSVVSPARPAFGPWFELQRCGTPRPCIVYQAKVKGGVITFSTWQLDPSTAAAILRTVATSPV